MKKTLPVEKYYHLINHGPCVLITSGNEKIKNVSPIAWVTPLNDDPPMVIICVAAEHYTSELIDKYKEFVINVPSIKNLELINSVGKISGKEVDKFKKFSIKYENGKIVKTVHLIDMVGYIEAKLWLRKEVNGVNLYIGKVLYCEVEKNFYNGNIIPQRAKTVHHIGANKFFVSSKIVQ
jgi:flavin reductase (DIM6/NTAB) family NADH-FMN oxidoreductase RutF